MLATNKLVLPPYFKKSRMERQNKSDMSHGLSHRSNLLAVRPRVISCRPVGSVALLSLRGRMSIYRPYRPFRDLMDYKPRLCDQETRRMASMTIALCILRRLPIKIESSAADTLSRLESEALEDSPVDDDIPILTIKPNLPVSPDEKKDDNFICSVCDKVVRVLPAGPGALTDETTNNVNDQPSVQEVIDEQSTDDFCEAPASFVGILGSHCSSD